MGFYANNEDIIARVKHLEGSKIDAIFIAEINNEIAGSLVILLVGAITYLLQV